jgi:hypothetical protein
MYHVMLHLSCDVSGGPAPLPPPRAPLYVTPLLPPPSHLLHPSLFVVY